MYQGYAAASLAHVESANKTHGIVGEPVYGMMENDNSKTKYSSKNNGVSPPSFLLRLRYGRNQKQCF